MKNEGTKKFLTETCISNYIRDFFMDKKSGGNWHIDKTKQAGLHQRGVDLSLRGGKTNGEYFFIECKKQSDQKENWLNALGQIITRINVSTPHGSNQFSVPSSYKYGLGLHKDMAKIALRRIPKKAAQILNLHIFSVDDCGYVKKWTPSKFGQDYSIEEFARPKN